jgi:NADH-quinone oxidoreductase subunit F
MDLRFAGVAPNEREKTALDALLGAPLQSWRGNGALGERRHLLLPALHAVHDATGWISRGALDEIARRLEVAPADVYGVASFYDLFSLAERPPRVVRVCVDLACQAAGSGLLVSGLTQRCGPPGHGEHWPTCADGAATWSESPCLGLCERAPAALVTQYGEGLAEAVMAPAVLGDLEAAFDAGPTGWRQRRPPRRPSPRWRPGRSQPLRTQALPAAGIHGSSCWGGSGSSTPPASTTTATTAATRPCGGP